MQTRTQKCLFYDQWRKLVGSALRRHFEDTLSKSQVTGILEKELPASQVPCSWNCLASESDKKEFG